MKKRIERLILLHTEEQKSQAWLAKRHQMITASDIATILDCNPYQTSKQLLIQKCKPPVHFNNDCTLWGELFEPIAREFYQKLALADSLHETGCIPHDKYPWLGASPDGVFLSREEKTGILLEIKCPKTRTITDEYPYMYWIQVQIQMECCNLNVCDLFQCQFRQYSTKEAYLQDTTTLTKGYSKATDLYWKLDNYKLHRIERDTKWFFTVLPQLKAFWKNVLYYRAMGPERLYQIVSSEKKVIDWSQWRSATQVKNYLMNDPCLDYLKVLTGLKNKDICLEAMNSTQQIQLKEYFRENKNITNGPSFLEMICKQGLFFEQNVISLLRNRFTVKMVTTDNAQVRSLSQFKKTLYFMKKGVPIIYHGVLQDQDDKLYGIPDLLVRSDYVNSLTTTAYLLEPHRKSVFSDQYHYVVVDIKYTTLTLTADGIHLTNEGRLKATKGQLCVYNRILGKIQGYVPTCAYILGKKWNYQKNGEKYSNNHCFDKLGVINYEEHDLEYVAKTQAALEWCNEVRDNFDNFTLFPPNDIRLYPNMCHQTDQPYQATKHKLANEIKEITAVWYCTAQHREKAFEQGVYQWDDPRCSADLLGITGQWKNPRIQAILEINQQKQDLLRCHQFQNTNNWTQTQSLEIFVDFETANLMTFQNTPDTIYSQDESLIIIIGCGYVVKGQWYFEKFTANQITQQEEIRIMTLFYNRVQQITQQYNNPKPRIYHWGHVERTQYQKLQQRTGLWGTLQWLDLCSVVQTEIIVFKDALTYGLKAVAKALYKHKLIQSCWSDTTQCVDGLDAMVSMLVCNELAVAKNLVLADMDAIKDIEKYNEIDCKVMWEILSVLRQQGFRAIP